MEIIKKYSPIVLLVAICAILYLVFFGNNTPTPDNYEQIQDSLRNERVKLRHTIDSLNIQNDSLAKISEQQAKDILVAKSELADLESDKASVDNEISVLKGKLEKTKNRELSPDSLIISLRSKEVFK